MKIRVSLTIEVDPEVWAQQWAEEYGLDVAEVRREVRQDVRAWAASRLHGVAELERVGVQSVKLA